MTPMRVLVIDDELSIRKLIEKELTTPHRTIVTAENASAAMDLVNRENFDVIVVDIRLPDGDGLDLLGIFREKLPDVEVIMITGYGTVESALKAMRLGAYDYITKPFNLERLDMILDKAYERVCLKRQNRRLLQERVADSDVPRLVGKSTAMRNIMHLIKKVALHDTSVLITGESGTGKDVVARNIHAMSPRSQGPFVVVNCASLQKDLLRSELFGFVKGAFTGALETREGLVSLAEGGTLFLDEIGDMPLELQATILHLLETKRYRRIGEQQERRANVRFLFATNRDLEHEVREGKFNEALYHRLNVFRIHIPPLRERREDIPVLAEYLMGVLGRSEKDYRLADETLLYLLAYDWPGNVRELRNVLERCLILSESDLILPNSLPRELVHNLNYDSETYANKCLSLHELERFHIQKVLNLFAGNISETAKALGISRKTLYRKIKAYGLQKQN